MDDVSSETCLVNTLWIWNTPCGFWKLYKYIEAEIDKFEGSQRGRRPKGKERGKTNQDFTFVCWTKKTKKTIASLQAFLLPPELILTFLPFRLIRRLRVAYALARKLTFDSRHSVNNPLDCDQFSTISYLCFNGNMQTNNSPHLKASEVTVVTGSREL